MARSSKSTLSGINAMLLLIVVVTAWTYRAWVLYAIYVFVAIIILRMILALFRRRLRDQYASGIDTMDGLDFERYIADLLIRHGYKDVQLTEKYDLGVDIIAHKDGIRWGIQVKRYSGLVKAEAVRQVVTALKAYGCDRSMVITNNRYSATAQRLAEVNNCVLIDRHGLAKMGKYRQKLL